MIRRIFGIIPCIVLLSLSLSCVEVPGEPVFPSWDVQISAALSRTTHSIEDLVDEIAQLPPAILDTLDLSTITLTFEESLVIGDTTGDGTSDVMLTEEFLLNVREARIYAEVENGTPAHLAVSLQVLDRDSTAILVLPSEETQLNVAAAPIDETGKVGAASTVVSFLDLDEDQVQRLHEAERFHYTIEISFPEGVQIEHVLSADTMSIRSWGTFLTRIQP